MCIRDSAIFETQKIDDTHATFPKAFIDEAVLEIARREDFGFTHYGLISDAILDLMEQGSEQVAADLLEQFRLLFKTAKRFHIDSLEAMMYQVNDGLDMIGVVTFLLDLLMEQGRRDKEQYRVLIAFVDKFLHVFSKTSDFFRVGMQYEQADVYKRQLGRCQNTNAENQNPCTPASGKGRHDSQGCDKESLRYIPVSYTHLLRYAGQTAA